MQTSNDSPNSRLNDSVWYFLAEYSLSELYGDMNIRDELMAGALFQTTRDLGIPAEHLNNIERTLMEFANEAMAHHNQGDFEPPVSIRLFCQKKVIDDTNLAKIMHPLTAEQPLAPAPIFHRPETEMNGGWGYFLIKRSGGFTPTSPLCTHNLVDLYLYKEGE